MGSILEQKILQLLLFKVGLANYNDFFFIFFQEINVFGTILTLSFWK